VEEEKGRVMKLIKSIELLDAQAGLAGAGAERKNGWHHSHSHEDNILFLVVPPM